MSESPTLTLEEVLAVGTLPTVPTVALEVLELSRDPEAGLPDIVRAIELDPALAAKVIETANSATYARGDAATSIERAGARLGMRSLTVIALSFSLATELPSQGVVGGLELGEYWERSLTTAVAGRLIGQALNSAEAEPAFLAGLVSNVGRLALAIAAPDAYESLVGAHGGWPTIEDEQELGITSRDVGAALLGRWSIPEQIIEAVYPDGEATSALAGIVAAASAVADFHHVEDHASGLDRLHRAMTAIGLNDDEADSIVEKVDVQLAETAAIMKLDLPSTMSGTDLLEQARMEMMNITLNTSMNLEAERERVEELSAQNAELEQAALSDRLTGLPNRAAFDQYIDSHLSSARRGTTTNVLGVALFDIDRFKSVNDTYGHAAGDTVLKSLGTTLSGTIRSHERVCRFGGEEFVFVSTGATLDELKVVGERLRALVELTPVDIGDMRLDITTSVGIACGPCDSSDDVDALLARADELLYQAKNNGRNRLES